LGAVASGLPIPPGPDDVPEPSGGVANLGVLPWAGFRAALTYTFDDSSPSQVAHYADIDCAGGPVTFYLTTSNSWYGGYEDTWRSAVAAGHELGNHTVHHCNFDAACGEAAQGSAEQEVDEASEYVNSVLGQSNVWTMAYPFGDTGYESVARQRFFLARGVGGGEVEPETGDPFDLPTFAAGGGESAAELGAAIDGVRSRGNWLLFLFHSLAPNSEAWYAPVNVTSVTVSIGHARSLEDVWIDTVANVGAYWVGARLVRDAVPNVSSGVTTWRWSLPEHFPPGRFVRVRVEGGTLEQGTRTVPWDGHGYYEVALDAEELTWTI
jgi:hypothetical protein